MTFKSALVTRIFNMWVERLSLRHWDVDWYWESGSESTSIGKAHQRYGSYHARIALNSGLIESFRDLYETIVHELLHLVYAHPYQSIGCRLRDSGTINGEAFKLFWELWSEQFEFAHEQTTQALAAAYWEKDAHLDPSAPKPKGRKK